MHAHSLSEIQLILCNGNCIDDLKNYFPDYITNSGLNSYHSLLKSEICRKYYKKFPKFNNLIKAKNIIMLNVNISGLL